MDSFHRPIYLLDAERRLVRATRCFYAMLQLDSAQVVGKHIAAIVHPQGEAVPCPVCRAQEEKRDALITMEADHPDNTSRRPIEVSIKTIRDMAQVMDAHQRACLYPAISRIVLILTSIGRLEVLSG